VVDGRSNSNLVAINPGLDLGAVRELLARITERGFARGQDLGAKLDAILATLRPS
jgi:hypothetical protein